MKVLMVQEIKWAHEKWCTGYSLQEIADALYVNELTLRRALKGYKKIRPKLVYPREVTNIGR